MWRALRIVISSFGGQNVFGARSAKQTVKNRIEQKNNKKKKTNCGEFRYLTRVWHETRCKYLRHSNISCVLQYNRRVNRPQWRKNPIKICAYRYSANAAKRTRHRGYIIIILFRNYTLLKIWKIYYIRVLTESQRELIERERMREKLLLNNWNNWTLLWINCCVVRRILNTLTRLEKKRRKLSIKE